MFEARKVAGSAAYNQSKVCCAQASVRLVTTLSQENKESLDSDFSPKKS